MKKKQVLDRLSGSAGDEEDSVDYARRSVLGGIAVSGLAATGVSDTDERSEPEPLASDEAKRIIQERQDVVKHLEEFEEFVSAAEDVDSRVTQFAEKAQRQELHDREGQLKTFAVLTAESSSGEIEMGFAREDSEVFVRFSADGRGEEFRSLWNRKHQSDVVATDCPDPDCSGSCEMEDCDCCPEGTGYCGCECANVLPAPPCNMAYKVCTCCSYHSWCAGGCTHPPYLNC